MYSSIFDSFDSSFDEALRRIRSAHVRMADLFERPFVAAPSSQSVSVRMEGNRLNITTRNGSCVYRVYIPDVNGLSSESPVKVYQAGAPGEQEKTREIRLGEFISENLENGYRRLHDKVISVLQDALAAVNLKLPAAAQPAKLEQSETSSDSSASESAAQASQEPAESQQPVARADAEGAIAEVPAAAEKKPEFSTYLIRREGKPDLQFQGKLIAQVYSATINRRQHVLEVYETPSGKFVAVKAGLSWWLGERSRYEALVAASKEDLVEFFGYGAYAKALYEQLGLSTVETVD